MLYPIPTAVYAFAYRYSTDLIVDSSIAVGQTGWLADTDVPNVDAYLVQLNATWRLLKNAGETLRRRAKGLRASTSRENVK